MTDTHSIEMASSRSIDPAPGHNARLNAFVKSTLDGMYDMDAHGRCTFINDAGAAMLGYAPDELMGRPIHDAIHYAYPDGSDYPVEACHIRRCAKLGICIRVDSDVFWKKDGVAISVEYLASPLILDGRAAGAVVSFRDITERRQLAEHVLQSQKLESLGGLAGGIAHDFNTLLTVIRINADLIGDGLPDEKRPELVELIKAAERATSLTQQLLAYSRKQFLNSLPTDLNEVVSNIEVMLRRLIPENLDIVVALAPSLKAVSVDRVKIEQVITNLVINARDAASEGGRITIQTVPLQLTDRDSDGWGVVAGEYVLLSVSDDGQGMPDEVRERAFEPFFTTKPEGQGTGLGLSMVYGIVKQSGGEIRILSDPNEGTTVQMLFPVVASAAEAASVSARTETARGSETILVVEDQLSLRKVAHRILSGAGYTVFEATDGEDALSQFSELIDSVDLVLTDLVMPRMGGRELVRRLREVAPSLKVMYMSGYSSEAASSTTSVVEGANLLQKPFNRETLLRAIRRAIDEG